MPKSKLISITAVVYKTYRIKVELQVKAIKDYLNLTLAMSNFCKILYNL
jgi:hypothetical protein